MNLYEKMSAITNEITAVAKNLNVGWGKNSYKAVGEADVLAAVKPIEAKYKVYSYPLDRDMLESAVLTTSRQDGGESKQQFMRLRTVYRFVDMESPEDHIDIVSYGDGVDSQDKAPGKAMTYADKYALLKAYKIITGDDPDQYYSDDLKEKTAKGATGAGTARSAPSPASRSRQANTRAQTQQTQVQPPAQQSQPPAEPQMESDPNKVPVNKNHIAVLKKEMERTGITEHTILTMFKVDALEDMTMAMFKTAKAKFEKTPSKQAAAAPPPAPSFARSSDPLPELPDNFNPLTAEEQVELPFV